MVLTLYFVIPLTGVNYPILVGGDWSILLFTFAFSISVLGNSHLIDNTMNTALGADKSQPTGLLQFDNIVKYSCMEGLKVI